MPVPLKRHKKIKKRRKKFLRHQGDRFMRISYPTWRKPKGIDSRVRRRFRGCIPMVNIGYGTDKRQRHVLPCGFKKFRVHTVKELEVLMMHNRKYAAEIGGKVGIRKRQAIIDRAIQLDIKILNPGSSTRAEENE